MVAGNTSTTTHGGPMRFSAARWSDYLTRRGIPWPCLESGALALDDDTFREIARAYPEDVGPIRELRHALSQLRLQELAVGPDGRNRCLLSVFASRTGRNQPSNSKFIFGPSAWLRSLIRPEPGRAVAYVDWSQQELAIAAAFSGDRRMLAIDPALEKLIETTDLVARAALLAAGFHQHKRGEWRKRHGQEKDEAGPVRG